MINDQIREAAAANNAVVLKVGRKLSAAQLGALPSDSDKAISEWEPLAVFEQRIESYDGDLSTDCLKQCFTEVLHLVQEDDTQ